MRPYLLVFKAEQYKIKPADQLLLAVSTFII